VQPVISTAISNRITQRKRGIQASFYNSTECAVYRQTRAVLISVRFMLRRFIILIV